MRSYCSIVDHGKIIALGTPAELLNEHFASTLIRLPDKYQSMLESIEIRFNKNGHYLDIFTDEANQVLSLIEQQGVDLKRCRMGAPTLEDLFLKLTGHGLRG